MHSVLKIVFMMFPNYCLGRGLIELAFNEYKNEFYFKTGERLCTTCRGLVTLDLTVVGVEGGVGGGGGQESQMFPRHRLFI